MSFDLGSFDQSVHFNDFDHNGAYPLTTRTLDNSGGNRSEIDVTQVKNEPARWANVSALPTLVPSRVEAFGTQDHARFAHIILALHRTVPYH